MDKTLTLTVCPPGEDPVELETVVDRELEEFNRWAETTLGERLSRPERAIVKTYLGWKLGATKEETGG